MAVIPKGKKMLIQEVSCKLLSFKSKGDCRGESEGLQVTKKSPLILQSLKCLKHRVTQEIKRSIFQLQDLITSFNHKNKSVEIQDILVKFWNHQRIHSQGIQFSEFVKMENVFLFFWWWLRKHKKQRKKPVSVIEMIFPEHHLQTWPQSS